MKYYKLMPDIFAEYVPDLISELDSEISFINGTIISNQINLPLLFSTEHTLLEPLKGLHCLSNPIMSDLFISTLQLAGVLNLQFYPCEIKSSVDGTIWKNYKIVNIIGLIACADLNKSEYTNIIDRPVENSIPLMAFEELKIDTSRTYGQLLFRLAEDPCIVIVSERVVTFLRKQKTDEEWGITLKEC